MEKSQIRRLAANFADGDIGEADYRREKARLIDGIVSGEIAIEREAAPLPATAPAENLEPTEEPPRTQMRAALSIAVGVIVLGGIAWLLYPSTPDTTKEAARNETIATTAPPVAAHSPLRSMVDYFLAANDWTESALETFERDWLTTAEVERADALNAPWFRRLATVLRQEINAQKAMAELDDTGLALHKGQRLVEFGTLLGLGADLPAFASPPRQTETAQELSIEPATSPRPQSVPQAPAAFLPLAAPAGLEPLELSPPPPLTGQDIPPPLTGQDIPPPLTGQDVPPPLPPEPTADSDAAWFIGQPEAHFTLQLFALNGLDRVDKLLDRFPDIDLRLIDLAGRAPRYRILHGSFANETAAENAHGRLPQAVTEHGGRPFIKTFGTLRENPSPTLQAEKPHLTTSPWAAEQPDDNFTLQIYAVESDVNIRNLPSKYASLDFHIHENEGQTPRYRVLLGSYPNRADAESAKIDLPTALLEEAGPPFVKRFDEVR